MTLSEFCNTTYRGELPQAPELEAWPIDDIEQEMADATSRLPIDEDES